MGGPLRLPVLLHHDQLLRRGIGERTQERRIDVGENGRIEADAQTEREDDDRAEARVASQHPEGKWDFFHGCLCLNKAESMPPAILRLPLALKGPGFPKFLSQQIELAGSGSGSSGFRQARGDGGVQASLVSRPARETDRRTVGSMVIQQIEA